MDRNEYKEMRIREIGDRYRSHSSSKTEWDKCIAMECAELPVKHGNTNGAMAIKMLLECKYTATEIDNELTRLFPSKKNMGRAKRMASIFSNQKCKNVEVWEYNGLIGLKWDRYKFFDAAGNWQND